MKDPHGVSLAWSAAAEFLAMLPGNHPFRLVCPPPSPAWYPALLIVPCLRYSRALIDLLWSRERLGVRRLLAYSLATLLALCNHYLANGLSAQAACDFLLAVPVALAAFCTRAEGVALALTLAALRFFSNPAFSSRPLDRVAPDFILDATAYVLVAVTVYGFRMAQSQKVRLTRTTSATAKVLLGTLDARDGRTGRHSRAVAIHARNIASRMGFTLAEQEEIYLAGLFHDLGKVAMSDDCLRKKGPLNPGEWDEMRQHPVMSYEILRSAAPELSLAASAVLYHHERYDGTGYPRGLRGDTIPLPARILAVADAFDAMTSTRPYKPAMPTHTAIAELQRCAGTQFDPRVVDAFIAMQGKRGRAAAMTEAPTAFP